MSTEDLSQKVARLIAIEDIKNLKATYCTYCDSNYDPKGLSNLFVEDGVWDGGPEFGKHTGKQAIHDFFVSASGSIVFAAHLVMNPIINGNGDFSCLARSMMKMALQSLAGYSLLMQRSM
jgi:hypothetical protein